MGGSLAPAPAGGGVSILGAAGVTGVGRGPTLGASARLGPGSAGF